MSRSKGLAAFSANFEPQVAAPLDARQIVTDITDLVSTAIWEASDGSVYAYKGMRVNVTDSSDANDNGVYFLKDTPYTNPDNWEKVGAGFDKANQYNGLFVPSDWTLSYDSSTRTISAIVGSDTLISANSTVLTISADNYTETHTNLTGFYYLVITSTGTMRFDTSFNFLTEAIVAYVYYNATSGQGILFDERHPADPGWPASMHRHFHQTVGAIIVSGGVLTGITVDDNANASMQFSVSSLIFDDESLRVTLDALTGGDGAYTIFHRSGADANNEWSVITGQNVPVSVSNDNPQYNQLSAGNWTLTELTSNNTWVNYYLIGTNAIETDYQYLLIPGQTAHSSLGDAEVEDFLGGISFGDFPIAEIVPLAKLTVRRATGTGNNFYINEWINLRGTRANLSVTTIPSSHNSLSDRDYPGSHPASAISYGEESDVETELGLKLSDAPSDGDIYGRGNGAWVPIPIGSTDAPTLTAYTQTLNEFTTVDLEILNYDASQSYTVESLDETKAVASRSENYLSITTLEVTEDTSTTVRIRTSAAGEFPSSWTEVTVNIVNASVEADDVIQVVDFTNEGLYVYEWELV